MALPATPADAARLRQATPSCPGKARIHNRGRWPRWETDAGLHFLTFQLADALPKELPRQLAEHRRLLEEAKQAGAQLLPEQMAHLAASSRRSIEASIDSGCGRCLLADPRIAGTAAATLRHRHNTHYRLYAWCVMPNHVHVVVKLFSGMEIGAVVRRWKLHIYKAAKHALNPKGTFWRKEFFDHPVRNEAELRRAMQYVMENPAKAGLKNWPWVWNEDQEAASGGGP